MKKVLNIPSILIVVGVALFLSGCYSCKSWNDFWGKGCVAPEVAEKLFWDKNCRPIAPPPLTKPPPAKPKPTALTDCGPYTVSRTYPCGNCGSIRLDKTMPREVQLNETFEYSINVTNLTDLMLAEVKVTDVLAKNFKFKSANPSVQKDDNQIVWKIGSLEPRACRKITVSGSATNTDCIKNCATVTYVVPACANVKVVEPKLKLVKTAPPEVLLCEPIPVKLVVTNLGTGSAQNVKIEDALPAGLLTAQDQTSLVFDAGTLAAGQSRQFSATLKATKTGKYVNKAVASSLAGLKAESLATIIVRQPVLTISKTGPARQYLGRDITYEITVKNNGDAPASNLVVEDKEPTATRFVSASDGGRLVRNKVVWNLGTLSPNHSRKVSLTLSPQQAGDVTNTAMATATCAEGVSASARTTVAGIPAVLLEVIDIDDPVEVGNRTTYLITATNQGSSPGTNIRIVCTLEDNQQYISSSGATKGTIEGNTLTFEPLRALAPKAKAAWRVVLKAVKSGDVRFKVTMNTDQITRPVEETEATHLYE